MLYLRAALAAVACLFAAAAVAAGPDDVRINQLQFRGSHNSYHAGFGPHETQVWQSTFPEVFAGLDYRHPKLTQQLDDGVRQFELDIYADAQGGRYAHPTIDKLVSDAGMQPDPPPYDAAVMQAPGFKVMHIQDFDQRANCQPLIACLQEIRAWSKAHPHHLPIFILLETEESPLKTKLPTVIPEPYTAATLDALDAEITSVFPLSEMIRPDDVRGKAATLNQAILEQGWPTLRTARGKVIFLLDQHKVGPAYLEGHPSLRSRVLFTNATPGEPDAAFVELNDGPAAQITKLVRLGYLVRTRTDADLKEMRANDTSRRDAMMASGAQILSTDFPNHEPADNGYVVSFPGNSVARCNPLFTSAPCRVTTPDD